MVLLLFIYKMFIHVKVMCSYVAKATHKSYATELKDIVNISYEVTCFLHDISDTLPIYIVFYLYHQWIYRLKEEINDLLSLYLMPNLHKNPHRERYIHVLQVLLLVQQHNCLYIWPKVCLQSKRDCSHAVTKSKFCV
jgi:hypothetical protein